MSSLAGHAGLCRAVPSPTLRPKSEHVFRAQVQMTLKSPVPRPVRFFRFGAFEAKVQENMKELAKCLRTPVRHAVHQDERILAPVT